MRASELEFLTGVVERRYDMLSEGARGSVIGIPRSWIFMRYTEILFACRQWVLTVDRSIARWLWKSTGRWWGR